MKSLDILPTSTTWNCLVREIQERTADWQAIERHGQILKDRTKSAELQEEAARYLGATEHFKGTASKYLCDGIAAHLTGYGPVQQGIARAVAKVGDIHAVTYLKRLAEQSTDRGVQSEANTAIAECFRRACFSPAPRLDQGWRVNVKDRIEKAKQLYKAGKYQAARNELAQVDHPKATEWIARLDVQHGTKPMRPSRLRWLWGGLAFVVLVFLVISFFQIRASSRDSNLFFTTQFACNDVVRDILYDSYDLLHAPEDVRDAVFDETRNRCTSWIALIHEDVLSYCVDAYNAEVADASIKRPHLIDCITERSSDSMTSILASDILILGGMIQQGQLPTATAPGFKPSS